MLLYGIIYLYYISSQKKAKNMENFILQLLILFSIMVIAGIAMAVLAIVFIKRKTYPILSVLFAILLCPCIYIPIKFTVGLIFARCVLVILLAYSAIVVILSVRNIVKRNNSKDRRG